MLLVTVQSVYSNTSVAYLLANATTEFQSLYQGIIETAKRFYQKYLAERTVSEIFGSTSTDSSTELCKKVTMLDAFQWIAQSWKDVSKFQQMRNVFIKHDFVSKTCQLLSIPEKTSTSYIPDFDDKISIDYQLTPIR